MAVNWLNDINQEDMTPVRIGTSKKSIEEWSKYKLGRMIKYIRQ